MAYDAEALATPDIHWLGIHLSDCKTFDVPKNCLLPLNSRDRQKAKAILKRSYLEYCAPSWRKQMENMLHQGVKLEVEAISASSSTFLTEYYLPLKIQNASHLYKNETWNRPVGAWTRFYVCSFLLFLNRTLSSIEDLKFMLPLMNDTWSMIKYNLDSGSKVSIHDSADASGRYTFFSCANEWNSIEMNTWFKVHPWGKLEYWM